MLDAHHETIVVSRDGPVGRLELDRPERRNAQNVRMLDEIDGALAAAERDPELRVLVVSGRGPSFCSGHDLEEVDGRADLGVEERWAYEQEYYFAYALRLWDFAKPTIAQVQGHCVAGGFVLANMCDLIVAAEDAQFADPVVHRLGAASGEILIHPWVLGHRKAREMLYTGEPVSAADALACGMVNRVVPREQLEAETLGLARRIAEAPAFATRLVKRSLNHTLDVQGLRTALAAHFDSHLLTHYTRSWREAVGESSR